MWAVIQSLSHQKKSITLMIHSLAYFYLVSMLYCYLFCPTGRQGSTSVLSAAFSYGKLGRVSLRGSGNLPSSSAHSKSRSSPSCCYSIWLLPSAVTVTFSWRRTTWKNLNGGQKWWATEIPIWSLDTDFLLTTAELLAQYEAACTCTRRRLNTAYPTKVLAGWRTPPTNFKINNL
jgi:hypothetical protein